MARSVETIYGDAFYEALLSAGHLEEGLRDAEALLEAFAEKREADPVLASLCPETEGLFSAVLEKGREDAIPGILRAFILRAKEEAGIGTAVITSAFPLSDEKKEEIVNKLRETGGYRSVEAEWAVDPSLIGGIVVKLGGRMVDGSVRTRIMKMKRELKDLKIKES